MCTDSKFAIWQSQSSYTDKIEYTLYVVFVCSLIFFDNYLKKQREKSAYKNCKWHAIIWYSYFYMVKAAHSFAFLEAHWLQSWGNA